MYFGIICVVEKLFKEKIMRAKWLGVVGVIAMCLATLPVGAQAEIIKIGFSGYVDGINDPYNLLEGAVTDGAPISGYYIYDSLTSDSDPSIYTGLYEYSAAPYGMSLTIGTLTFQTDPANVDLEIGLSNNYYGETWDYYTIRSNNNLELDTGVSIDSISWQLTDNTGNALSSDILPLGPPDLSAWQYDNHFSVRGGRYPFPPEGEKTLFNFGGYIDSVWLIPEPATLILFGLSGLLIRKRK